MQANPVEGKYSDLIMRACEREYHVVRMMFVLATWTLLGRRVVL